MGPLRLEMCDRGRGIVMRDVTLNITCNSYFFVQLQNSSCNIVYDREVIVTLKKIVKSICKRDTTNQDMLN